MINIAGEVFYIYKTRHYIRNFYPELYSILQGGIYKLGSKKTQVETTYYDKRIEVFKLLKNKMNNDKKTVIFVGDSIIETFEWTEYFSDMRDIIVLNRGIAGETIHGLIGRFEITFLPELHPEVFLMIGINDISLKNVCPDGKFLDEYKELLDELLYHNIQPTDIFVLSILPARREDKSNDVIRSCNEGIKEYCHKKLIHYIDIYSQFVDDNGWLNPKYSLDGVHLNAEGYSILSEVVRKYMSH
jgi:lysophospholipase L1-like esterase